MLPLHSLSKHPGRRAGFYRAESHPDSKKHQAICGVCGHTASPRQTIR